MKKRLAVLAALASTVIGGSAIASGFLVARFGGEFGHPTTDNLSAMYYNPAGLSLLGGTRLYVDGSFAFRSVTFTRDAGGIDNILTGDPGTEGTLGTPAGDGVAANSGEASLFNFIASPFIGVGTDFGVEGLGVALGFYTPIGGQSSWDEQSVGPDFPYAADGPQRWWVIEGTIRTSYITLAAGYEIPKTGLSIGLGANLGLTTVDTVRARNANGRDDMVTGDSISEGRGQLTMTGVDLSLSFGLLWQPVKGLFIGASYQSQPGFGEQELEGSVRLKAASSAETKFDGVFKQSLPDVFRLGFRYQREKAWEVRLFGELARWSLFEYQCLYDPSRPDVSCDLQSPNNTTILIPRQWDDAFGIRGGASFWLNDDIELFAGAGFDQNAVPDAVAEPSLIDHDKVSAALGAKISLLDGALELNLSYTHVFYFTRDIAPRGRIANPDGAGTVTDFVGAVGVDNAARQPDAAGEYKQTLGLVTLGVGYKF